jgi:ubiquinone/menaquinone biosynthesis C-methylase UbiE
VERTDPAYAGQAVYTRRGLRGYDALVYGFNFPVLWRCPKSRLIDNYNANVSGRHLDIGVATGKLLDECRFPVVNPEITLMDLNPNSLQAASERLARYSPRTHQANVLEPWGLEPGAYDSVAMTSLLHCLPGKMPEKAVAFEHARAVLSPGGVMFGATILGKGVKHNRMSRWMHKVSNRRGVMSNLDDNLDDLDAALGRIFPSHQVEVEGVIALFAARTAA